MSSTGRSPRRLKGSKPVSFIQGSTLSVTANSSGEVSTYSNETLNGFLQAIQYTPGSSAFSTAAGATFSGEISGIKYLVMSPFNSTVDTVYSPRTSIHSTAGSTVAGFERFPVVNERIKVDLSSAGAGKTGTFRFFLS